MRERLFIQYKADEPVQCQVVDSSGKPAAGTYRGGLEDIAHFAQGRQVIVVVPATDLLCYRPSVPKASLLRLRQAVPFLLEDNLLSPLSDYHFALGERDDEGYLAVNMYPREFLSKALQDFDTVGIRPVTVIPDSLCLPWEAGQWSLYLDESGVRIRTNEFEAFYSEWENVEILIQSLLAEASTAPDTFQVFADDTQALEARLEQLKEYFSIDPADNWQSHDTSLFALCFQNYAQSSAINLLQGELKPKLQFDRQMGSWRLVAGLLAVWLVIQLLSYAVGYWQLSREVSWLDEHIETEVRSAFPEIKTIRQPLNQVNNALRELRGQAGESPYHKLISAIGKASQAQAVTLEELTYRNQRMTISLQLPDLQSVNRYEQALQQQRGIRVKVLSAKKKDKRVSARIEISGGRK